MHLASSAFLRRAAAMSSYYNPRGSPRPRRGYTARPSPPPPPDSGAELVSGDSHLSAVRAANDSLRRGGGATAPPPSYRHVPQPHPPPYGYVYGQPQQPGPPYGFVPYRYGHPQPPGPQYGYGTPNQYGFGHPQPYGGVPQNAGFPPPNAGFRPGAPQMPPRLAEYRRRRRFAQRRPPRQAGNIFQSW